MVASAGHLPTAATPRPGARAGISDQTLYNWKAKYGGLKPSEASRLKGLEDENRRLKKLLAEAVMDNSVLRELLRKN